MGPPIVSDKLKDAHSHLDVGINKPSNASGDHLQPASLKSWVFSTTACVLMMRCGAPSSHPQQLAVTTGRSVHLWFWPSLWRLSVEFEGTKL